MALLTRVRSRGLTDPCGGGVQAGIVFYESQNGVILSDGIRGVIPPEFFAKVEFVPQ